VVKVGGKNVGKVAKVLGKNVKKTVIILKEKQLQTSVNFILKCTEKTR